MNDPSDGFDEASPIDSPDRREFMRLSTASAATAMFASAAGVTGAAPIPTTGGRKSICVLGASGNVGGAIVRALLSRGHQVIAVSRSAQKLEAMRKTHAGSPGFEVLQGDVESDAKAGMLRDAIVARFGKPAAVVASLSSPDADHPMRILATPTDQLRRAFETNFFSHVTCATTLIPAMQAGGVYVGINGGMSDFVVPNMGQLSMTQSALRSLYSVLAKEAQDGQAPDLKVQVRMLALYGLVAADAAGVKDDGWIAGPRIGERVVEIIERPADSPGPILAVKARKYA